MINYKIKINFQDTKILTSGIELVSGDVGAYKFSFEFYDNGKRVDISKYTLTIRARRSDGVVVAGAGNIQDNAAVFIPENNFYAVPGELYMEIALSDSAGRYATTKIIIASVVQGLGEEAIEGADKLSVYVTLLNDAQSKIDQANRLIEDSVPVKGIDYWTEEDKSEIKSFTDAYIKAEIDEKLEPLVIIFDDTSWADDSWPTDTTYNEVLNAVNEGKRIKGILGGNTLEFVSITASRGFDEIQLRAHSGNAVYLATFYADASKKPTFTQSFLATEEYVPSMISMCIQGKADKDDTYTKTEVDEVIQSAILDSWEVPV